MSQPPIGVTGGEAILLLTGLASSWSLSITKTRAAEGIADGVTNR